VSLNILLSHSIKVIRNDSVEYGVCKSLLVFQWDYVSRTVSEIFSVKDGVTLNRGLVGVVQGQWKWRRSIDHDFLLVRHCTYSSILCRFWVIWRWKISRFVTLKSGLEVTQGHSSCCHSRAWVRFPICLR